MWRLGQFGGLIDTSRAKKVSIRPRKCTGAHASSEQRESGRLQAGAQRVQLVAQGLGHPIAELRVVLLGEVGLGQP